MFILLRTSLMDMSFLHTSLVSVDYRRKIERLFSVSRFFISSKLLSEWLIPPPKEVEPSIITPTLLLFDLIYLYSFSSKEFIMLSRFLYQSQFLGIIKNRTYVFFVEPWCSKTKIKFSFFLQRAAWHVSQKNATRLARPLWSRGGKNK